MDFVGNCLHKVIVFPPETQRLWFSFSDVETSLKIVDRHVTMIAYACRAIYVGWHSLCMPEKMQQYLFVSCKYNFVVFLLVIEYVVYLSMKYILISIYIDCEFNLITFNRWINIILLIALVGAIHRNRYIST